jgi:hypothetical protein
MTFQLGAPRPASKPSSFQAFQLLSFSFACPARPVKFLPCEMHVMTERSSFHRGFVQKELVPLKSAEQIPAGVQPGRSGFNQGGISFTNTPKVGFHRGG